MECLNASTPGKDERPAIRAVPSTRPPRKPTMVLALASPRTCSPFRSTRTSEKKERGSGTISRRMSGMALYPRGGVSGLAPAVSNARRRACTSAFDSRGLFPSLVHRAAILQASFHQYDFGWLSPPIADQGSTLLAEDCRASRQIRTLVRCAYAFLSMTAAAQAPLACFPWSRFASCRAQQESETSLCH